MDVLTLGGVTFDSFSTPSNIGAGGKQAMVVHRLPGGARVINTLGPDERNIEWNGEFYSNDANSVVQTLDAMRVSGNVYGLSFGGQYRDVIIDTFTYDYIRYPVWIKYRIACVVYTNPALGNVSVETSTIDTLIISDLESAAENLGG